MDEEQESKVTKQIGDYNVVLEPVFASGTFGTIHEATHIKTNDFVVAKKITLSESGEINETKKKMADREMNLLKRLQYHRNIVQFITYEWKFKAMWMFLEFCDLGHLGVYLRKRPDVGILERITIISQIFSAVHFMHCNKIIHRDLKLDNILMKRENSMDVVKVTDFGLSKEYDRASKTLALAFSNRTVTATACGSYYFMAPEFFLESEHGIKYNETVDIFALGLIMKVIIEYSRTKPMLIPLSVRSVRDNLDVSIGQEMAISHQRNEDPPALFEQDNPDRATKRLRIKIKSMTQVEADERLHNLKYLIDDIEELAEEFSGEGSIPATHVSKEPMEITTNKPKLRPPTGISDLRSLEETRLSEVNCVQMTWEPQALCEAYENLYTIEHAKGIGVYNKMDKMAKVRQIEAGSMGEIRSVAEVGDGKIAVAAMRGLFIIDQSGKVLTTIEDGMHTSVCCASGNQLYAFHYDSRRIHIYERKHGDKWARVKDIQLRCKPNNVVTLVRGTGNLYAVCTYDDCVFVLCPTTGKELAKHNLENKLNRPSAAFVDLHDNLLLVDHHNNRLVVLNSEGEFISLITSTTLKNPTGAVIANGYLYVTCLDRKLLAFKLKQQLYKCYKTDNQK